MLIKRSNLTQQYAHIYLLQSHSTCFGRHSTHHQETLKTVTATSGIGHSTGTATSFQPRWKEVAVNKYLHIVASSWTFLLTLNHDARNHEFKKKSIICIYWLHFLFSKFLLSSILNCFRSSLFISTNWFFVLSIILQYLNVFIWLKIKWTWRLKSGSRH